MALTDKEIQALKPREKKYKIFDGDGLYLLVHPRGWKYWYMKYHIAARPHEVPLALTPPSPSNSHASGAMKPASNSPGA